MVLRPSIALAALLLSLPALADPLEWRDESHPAVAFVDILGQPAAELDVQASTALELPFEVELLGRRYDTAIVSPTGRITLRHFGGGPRGRPRTDATTLEVFGGASAGPRSRLLVTESAAMVSVRWSSFLAGPGAEVTFEALLHADGSVRFQYPFVEPYLRGAGYGTFGRVGLLGPAGTGTELLVDGVPAPGFELHGGAVVEFPPRGPSDPSVPHDAECPPAHGLPGDLLDHCTLAQLGPDRVAGTGDEKPGCVELAAFSDPGVSPCGLAIDHEWKFNEQAFCRNCPYVFYARVDCGSQMRLPTWDVEAMTVSVTDLRTGERMLIAAENECLVRRYTADPYLYCDACDFGGFLLAKDDQPGGCPADEIGCLSFLDTGLEVGWGRPLDPDEDGNVDENGDGFVDLMDRPPCDDCNEGTNPACRCPLSTSASVNAQEQNVSISLAPQSVTPSITAAPLALLSSVYRVEVLSGGFVWDLYANCDGTDTPLFPIYTHCADALADYDPRPELGLPEAPGASFFVEDDTSCPASVQLAVTTCNVGGIPAVAAPFSIAFDDPGVPAFDGDNTAHPTDPSCSEPLEPGECRTCSWTVPLGAPALSASLVLDPLDVLAECSESPDAVACDVMRRRGQTIAVCGETADRDGDGLPDWRELDFGSNPLLADSDGDLLDDAMELALGTHPMVPDTDADGTQDAADTCPVDVDPLQLDTDGDGIGDLCAPGVRDVFLQVRKQPAGELLAAWGEKDYAMTHDLLAGDLDELRRTGTYGHDDVLACNLPTGPAGRLLSDDSAGRNRYYVLSVELPDGAEHGVSSLGRPRNTGVFATPCR